MKKTVLININSIGTSAGPFNISSNTDGIVSTGVLASQLISGYYVEVSIDATEIYIISTGICRTNITIKIDPVATQTTTPGLTKSATPTPTQTGSPTPTPTITKTPTQTLTNTQTPTNTSSPTPTTSVTATITATLTPTNTTTPGLSPTATATVSLTPSSTVTPTPTPTLSKTPTPTPTQTTTPTFTPTQTQTKTPTKTPTQTVNMPKNIWKLVGSYDGDTECVGEVSYFDCSGATQTVNVNDGQVVFICAIGTPDPVSACVNIVYYSPGDIVPTPTTSTP